ncbi:hypothetical protein SpCBS45565_g04336 [Spizellomyces sp. 'palustris']|nr:hypothetical protein SpCBS45565_g04336 [Spizellomyces sp. 'palustris']
MSSTPILEGVIIHKRWKILHPIGKGAFGEVHSAFDLHTQKPVAIKIEPPTSKRQVLKLEIAILRKVGVAGSNSSPWIAEFVGSGRFAITSNDTEKKAGQDAKPLPVYHFMVMQLLGPNLSEIRRNTPGHRFPLQTVTEMALQMLQAIQALHGIGVVHRDIKPGNFCVGPDYSPDKGLAGARVYMIDFGLSRKFINGYGTIREARPKVGFRGTSRYASLRAHKGQDLGPVDDMWTFFYLLVEFITGSLPWRGKEKDRIAAIKAAYHEADVGKEGHVTHGLPSPMVEMWKYLAGLDYEDPVDYKRIEKMVRDLPGDPGVSLSKTHRMDKWTVQINSSKCTVTFASSTQPAPNTETTPNDSTNPQSTIPCTSLQSAITPFYDPRQPLSGKDLIVVRTQLR